MNRGQARRETEETGWEDAGAAFPSLCAPIGTPSVVPVSTTRRARSTAATRRGTADPFADTEGALPDAATARRDWCVDRVDELLTMSTFELWTAIERGEVAPWMRVWREGMECWTPAGELLELSWAAASTPQPSAEAATSPLPPEPRPEPPPPAAERLAPAPAPHAPYAPYAEVPPRGARWVAVGSLVAAAAIAAAFFVAAGPGTATSVELRSAVAPAPPVGVAGAAGAARASELSAAPATVDPPRVTDAARREERGQRRLPRGGGRSYGR